MYSFHNPRKYAAYSIFNYSSWNNPGLVFRDFHLFLRLQKAGFDIERGEVNSEAVHRTVKQYKADMEKEKAELAAVIQGRKQELQAIVEKKADIRSVEEIATGKTQ